MTLCQTHDELRDRVNATRVALGREPHPDNAWLLCSVDPPDGYVRPSGLRLSTFEELVAEIKSGECYK